MLHKVILEIEKESNYIYDYGFEKSNKINKIKILLKKLKIIIKNPSTLLIKKIILVERLLDTKYYSLKTEKLNRDRYRTIIKEISKYKFYNFN